MDMSSSSNLPAPAASSQLPGPTLNCSHPKPTPWLPQSTDTAAAQVYIVGPESQIDMMPSSKWLAEHTSRWAGFKTHLLINIKRDEALDIISAEGMLLVLCSMVDNMPYVVAEAAVKLPFPSSIICRALGHPLFQCLAT